MMKFKWILRIACMLQVGSLGVLFCFEAVRMKDLGLGETTIGIILGINSGLYILSSLFWGRYADRKKCHKQLVVIGSIGFTVLFFFFSACNSALGFLVYAVFKAGLAPMVTGIMPAIALKAIGSSNQGRNYGIFRAFGSIGFILGSVLFPLIFKDIGTIAQVAAVIVGISALLVLRIDTPIDSKNEVTPLTFKNLSTPLRTFLISFFFIAISEPAIMAFYLAYARHLDASTQLLGMLTGAMGLVALVFLPLMGKWMDLTKPSFILSVAFLAQPIRILLISLQSEATMLWIPLLLHGLCWGGMEVASIVYLSKLVGKDNKAGALSYYMAVRMLGNLSGSAICGYLAENYSYTMMFQTIAAISLLGGMFYVTSSVWNHSLKSRQTR